MAILSIENLSLAFGGQTIFDNVRLAISDGEKIGLIGRNGSGKSTLLKVINGDIEPDNGKIRMRNGYIIGYLKQHIKFSHATVLEEVCSVLPEDRVYEEWKGSIILTGLGFTAEEQYKSPELFSGGFQVKINLAKLLLSEPHLLLLDEPTNYLDIHAISWLKTFLKSWMGELILVTHDRSFMDSVISHSLFIHRQEFRKMSGNTEKIYKKIEEEEEDHERKRSTQEKKIKETEDWIRRFGAKATLASRVKSKAKMLQRLCRYDKLESIDDLNFNFNSAAYNSKASMISADDISFGYSADMLFSNLSFHIEYGDKVCIIGANGKGKSTLLNLISNHVRPLSGNIQFNDRVSIGYFGQTNIDRLDNNTTIYEELQSSAPEAPQQKIHMICGQMLFKKGLYNKKISVLSGGERSRVMLGKILLQESNLLLLDEPMNHLDMQSCEALLDAISSFDGAVVMVMHNEDIVKEIANKLIVFDRDSAIYFDDTYDNFIKKIGWCINN